MTSTIDLAYARASVLRFLSLSFAYPTLDVHSELVAGIDAVRLASSLMSPRLAELAEAAATEIGAVERRRLAAAYRGTFTLSASPDCPMNESAYSAKHVYQEVQQLADIAGFYRAFGFEIKGERPDELAAELEFCALLALKEGLALEGRRKSKANLCRDAARLFVRDHLGRWAENIGRRVEILAAGTPYAALGRLLAGFAAEDIELLGAGPVSPYQEVPNPPEPIDDDGCPAEEGLGVAAFKLQDDFVSEFTQVGAESKGGLQ